MAETNGRSDHGRFFKTLDSVQEDLALLNYLLAKRDLREAFSDEQVVTATQQANATMASLNALSVTLDGLMPRRARTIQMTAGNGPAPTTSLLEEFEEAKQRY